MEQMFTLVFAAIGCLGGMAGTWIAIRAEIRATKAEKRSKEAQKSVEESEARAYWTDLIDSAQTLLGINVVYQDTHGPLGDLRKAMTELIDSPSAQDFKHLDRWFDAEHKMINGLFELANKRARSITESPQSPRNTDIIFISHKLEEAHQPANSWLDAFINNLRYARKTWTSEDVDVEFEKLARAAREALSKLKSDNPGLIPPPPTTHP